MFIQTEATDDPDSLRFLPGRPVLREERTVEIARDRAADSPLAEQLYAVDGVAGLAFGRDFITIRKSSGDWADIKGELLGIMADFLDSGVPVLANEGSAPAGDDGAHDRMSADIEEALKLVIDPELGYNIVDIGLIYDVILGEGGSVHIVMTTTTKGCPATNYLKQGAEGAAWSVDGVEAVEVEMTYDPPWQPSMMSDEAKDYFGITD